MVETDRFLRTRKLSLEMVRWESRRCLARGSTALKMEGGHEKRSEVLAATSTRTRPR